jgi:hypothetical protein
LDFFGFGSNGSIFSHCSCVNFHLCLAIKKLLSMAKFT